MSWKKHIKEPSKESRMQETINKLEKWDNEKANYLKAIKKIKEMDPESDWGKFKQDNFEGRKPFTGYLVGMIAPLGKEKVAQNFILNNCTGKVLPVYVDEGRSRLKLDLPWKGAHKLLFEEKSEAQAFMQEVWDTTYFGKSKYEPWSTINSPKK